MPKRFRGTLQGSRGITSRLGGATSGVTAHIHGARCGIRVTASVGEDGEDQIVAWMTNGDSGGYVAPLGTVTARRVRDYHRVAR